MDSQELSRRLVGIAKGSLGITITKRTCWIDGSDCPYGQPEGQFLFRPRQFCRPSREGSSGCRRVDDCSDELKSLVTSILVEGMEEKIKKAATKVSSELRALADQATGGGAKDLLKMVAELIEKKEFDLENREIVLLEDLEDFY